MAVRRHRFCHTTGNGSGAAPDVESGQPEPQEGGETPLRRGQRAPVQNPLRTLRHMGAVRCNVMYKAECPPSLARGIAVAHAEPTHSWLDTPPAMAYAACGKT